MRFKSKTLRGLFNIEQIPNKIRCVFNTMPTEDGTRIYVNEDVYDSLDDFESDIFRISKILNLNLFDTEIKDNKVIATFGDTVSFYTMMAQFYDSIDGFYPNATIQAPAFTHTFDYVSEIKKFCIDKNISAEIKYSDTDNTINIRTNKITDIAQLLNADRQGYFSKPLIDKQLSFRMGRNPVSNLILRYQIHKPT